MITRRDKLLLGIFLLFLFPAAWLLWTPNVSSGMTTCAFKLLTTKPCPFCGLTHALSCAVHGNFSDAFAYHWFWWLAAILLIGLALVSLIDGLTGAGRIEKLYALATSTQRYIIAALIAYTLYRF